MLPEKYTCAGQLDIFDYLSDTGELCLPETKENTEPVLPETSEKKEDTGQVGLAPASEDENYLEIGQTIFVNMDHQVTSLVVTGTKGKSYIAEDPNGKPFFVSNRTYNQFWTTSRQQAGALPSVFNK